jgi:hypothetical protein
MQNHGAIKKSLMDDRCCSVFQTHRAHCLTSKFIYHALRILEVTFFSGFALDDDGDGVSL